MDVNSQPQKELPRDDLLVSLVKRVMKINQLTWGLTQDDFLVYFQGHLTQNSPAAYDQLAQSLKPYQITPLFRKQEDEHLIILKEGIIEPQPRKTWINLVLFIITFFSVLFAGVYYSYSGPMVSDLSIIWSHVQPKLGESLGFAVSLLAILTAHEFGHYFTARKHKTKVTLPYFIPFPISPFGTMGAFINLQEPPKNKRVLLDIGIAGPLAGLVVAVPVLLYGLSLSSVQRLPQQISSPFFFEGNSLLYLSLKYIVHGQWLPQPADIQGLELLTYWLRFFFTGAPLPHGGYDVVIHPVAWAGWAGLLVTALNLLPAGQLDGGHLVYGLFGDLARKIWPYLLVILGVLGFVWSGWWLWAVLILIFGRARAQPLDQITELDPRRKILALFGLIIFVLVFIPVPIIVN